MATTIFSQMIAGQISCHRVYENDRVFAVLDANPISKGHTLLIPKEAAATMMQLAAESAAALGRVLPRWCRAFLQATGAPALPILQNNGAEAHQAIPHVHLHLIPKYADGARLLIPWQTMTLTEKTAGELVAALHHCLSLSAD